MFDSLSQNEKKKYLIFLNTALSAVENGYYLPSIIVDCDYTPPSFMKLSENLKIFTRTLLLRNVFKTIKPYLNLT